MQLRWQAGRALDALPATRATCTWHVNRWGVAAADLRPCRPPLPPCPLRPQVLEASLTARQGYVLQCLAVASVAGTGTEIDSLACILVEVATMVRRQRLPQRAGGRGSGGGGEGAPAEAAAGASIMPAGRAAACPCSSTGDARAALRPRIQTLLPARSCGRRRRRAWRSMPWMRMRCCRRRRCQWTSRPSRPRLWQVEGEELPTWVRNLGASVAAAQELG